MTKQTEKFPDISMTPETRALLEAAKNSGDDTVWQTFRRALDKEWRRQQRDLNKWLHPRNPRLKWEIIAWLAWSAAIVALCLIVSQP